MGITLKKVVDAYILREYYTKLEGSQTTFDFPDYQYVGDIVVVTPGSDNMKLDGAEVLDDIKMYSDDGVSLFYVNWGLEDCRGSIGIVNKDGGESLDIIYETTLEYEAVSALVDPLYWYFSVILYPTSEELTVERLRAMTLRGY
jgi:hypothetical protein